MKFYMCQSDYTVIRKRFIRDFIKGELITESEAKKYHIAYSVTASSRWKQVEIPKNKTFWSFGVRLPIFKID